MKNERQNRVFIEITLRVGQDPPHRAMLSPRGLPSPSLSTTQLFVCVYSLLPVLVIILPFVFFTHYILLYFLFQSCINQDSLYYKWIGFNFIDITEPSCLSLYEDPQMVSHIPLKLSDRMSSTPFLIEKKAFRGLRKVLCLTLADFQVGP